jgi:hypothetical protein
MDEAGITKLQCVNHDCDKCKAQRTWVGLTDKEKQEWIDAMPWPPQQRHIMVLIDGIESEIKENNS